MNGNHLYIMSGCNGAGKTTAAYTLLPEVLHCREFVNADEIARGLSPFNVDSVALEAGKLMLTRINRLLTKQADFAIETTLATHSHKNLITRAHDKGYRVVLIYFWLGSPELAIERVAARVRHGGHNIPPDVIRRRYESGLSNLFESYLNLADYWMIADNSNIPRTIIAEGGNDIETRIYDQERFNTMRSYARQ